MNFCSVEGCDKLGAFSTRTRPTWCIEHLEQLYEAGGLTLLDEFTKTTDYLLTRCTTCGFEAHYRFEYVLDRLNASERVCRACYWRTWAHMSRSIAQVSNEPVDVESVRRNAEAHGMDYLGPLTDPSLPDDPHGTRCRRCGRIEAQRNGDIGWGCPCQRNPKSSSAGTKKARGANLLRNSDADVVSWWDHDRNDEALWKSATLKARRDAWWICPGGHSFRARIVDVTSGFSPCPTCRDLRAAAWAAKRASYAGKTIADIPELLAGWDEPELDPTTVLADSHAWGSGYRFRCPEGHRNTRQPLSWLLGGCSACKAAETRRANKQAADADVSSSRLTPEISSQWHPTKNGKLRLADVSPESRRTVWWQDPVCGHEFQATPRERDKYERWRCEECRTILDSLAYHYPDVAEEWAPENKLSAWQVRPNSVRLAEVPLWICRNDPSHRWRSMPSARINGSQCPECQTAGKSQVELAYVDAAEQYWGNAKSGSRIHSPNFQHHASWTADVLVELPDGRSLVIEYDGAYWHRDKTEVDSAKSIDLIGAGYIVVRLREAPLPSLQIDSPEYHEITVYSGAQDPVQEIVSIARVIR